MYIIFTKILTKNFKSLGSKSAGIHTKFEVSALHELSDTVKIAAPFHHKITKPSVINEQMKS